MSFGRVYAIFMRHYFLAKRQLERIFDIFFFPTLMLVVWGFVTKYVAGVQSQFLIGFLLGGMILWVIFERMNTDIGISFMFDIWERNIVNLLASPLTFLEYILGLIIIGIFKILLAFLFMFLLSSLFYNFQLTVLGWGLAAFWLNLAIFAWAFGMVNISLVLRFGHTVGPLTWILPFLLQPFSAAFYPVSILPEFLQKVAWILPLSHVFEGMRGVLKSGYFDWGQFWLALGLNLIYLLAAIGYFAYSVAAVKKSGRLVKLA